MKHFTKLLLHSHLTNNNKIAIDQYNYNNYYVYTLNAIFQLIKHILDFYTWTTLRTIQYSMYFVSFFLKGWKKEDETLELMM